MLVEILINGWSTKVWAKMGDVLSSNCMELSQERPGDGEEQGVV